MLKRFLTVSKNMGLLDRLPTSFIESVIIVVLLIVAIVMLRLEYYYVYLYFK